MSAMGTGSRVSWRGLPLWLRDGLLALVLTAMGQVELVFLADEVSGSRPLQHAAFAVVTGSLVARRARPLAASVVGAVGLAFQTLLGDAPAVAGFLAMLVLIYSVAQYADRRRDAILGLTAILAANALYPLVNAGVSVADEIANMAIPVVLWLFARLARERLDRAVRAERETMAAQAQAREEEVARSAALAAERRRIAREMHDVVGHGVTLMLLHADAAQASLGGREPATARALDVVLTSGRTALADLQRLLRVLRDDSGTDDGEPGTLAAVGSLVETAAATGREVEVTVDGVVRPLPTAVEATGYRIVQECLTNALKHAPGASIRVRLTYGDAALEIEVADDGRGCSAASPPGHGLAGIRERAALFDGQVSAGPGVDGNGWRTSVVLPVPTREPAVA